MNTIDRITELAHALGAGLASLVWLGGVGWLYWIEPFASASLMLFFWTVAFSIALFVCSPLLIAGLFAVSGLLVGLADLARYAYRRFNSRSAERIQNQ